MDIAIKLLMILWAVRTIRSVLFHVSLWQVKEYRLDRFLVMLSEPEGTALFKHPANRLKILAIIALGVLLAAFFAGSGAVRGENNVFWSVFTIAWLVMTGALLLFYLGECVIFAVEVTLRRLKRPRMTLRAAGETLLTLAIICIALLAAIRLIHAPALALVTTPLLLIILDRLTPLVAALANGITAPAMMIQRRLVVARAAQKLRGLTGLKVIGITGSYAKSSTKECLAQLLSTKYRVLKTPENINTLIGIAQTIINELKTDHEIFVVEMGAYHRGEIREICDLVKPQVGILTGINEQHVALFGTLEDTRRAKYELIQALPRKTGKAIFNISDPEVASLAKKTRMVKVVTYGARPTRASYRVEKARISELGTEGRLKSGKILVKLTTKQLGLAALINLAGAIGAAHTIGMNWLEIRRGLRRIESAEGPMRMTVGFRGARIIDNSYSANPSGARAAFDILKSFKPHRRIAVVRSLIELGSYAPEIHRELGTIAAKAADITIFVGPGYARFFLDGVHNGHGFVRFEPNSRETCEYLRKTVRATDVVLLLNRLPHIIVQLLKHHGSSHTHITRA